MSLKIRHNYSGFFSCCSIKLHKIVEFINLHKKLPKTINSSSLFKLYKIDQSKDITYEYFKDYNEINLNNIISKIDYYETYQYKNYKYLDFNAINPIVKKYFSPSNNILEIINEIENKYTLNYNNICVLFYRGNDKITETKLSGYDEYLVYANKVLEENPNILFLIQSDESEFIEFMINKFPNNSFYFKDEIRHMKKCNNSVDKLIAHNNFNFSKKYLAITFIMSRCKYIICGSGNCSIWIMLFRGNSLNLFQNLNGEWY